MSSGPIQCVMSGGQTGVDRAALDAALKLGIPHDGWCPRGRRAEDGIIPPVYQLRQTPSRAYHVRTEWNVRDSDGTLILHQGQMSGGTELTARLAREHRRPMLCVDLSRPPFDALVRDWWKEHAIGTLNVAGPRESTAPGIGQLAYDFLLRLLGPAQD